MSETVPCPRCGGVAWHEVSVERLPGAYRLYVLLRCAACGAERGETRALAP